MAAWPYFSVVPGATGVVSPASPPEDDGDSLLEDDSLLELDEDSLVSGAALDSLVSGALELSAAEVGAADVGGAASGLESWQALKPSAPASAKVTATVRLVRDRVLNMVGILSLLVCEIRTSDGTELDVVPSGFADSKKLRALVHASPPGPPPRATEERTR